MVKVLGFSLSGLVGPRFSIAGLLFMEDAKDGKCEPEQTMTTMTLTLIVNCSDRKGG